MFYNSKNINQHFTFGEISNQTKHKNDEPALNKNKPLSYKELREIIDSEMGGELNVNKPKNKTVKSPKIRNR